MTDGSNLIQRGQVISLVRRYVPGANQELIDAIMRVPSATAPLVPAKARDVSTAARESETSARLVYERRAEQAQARAQAGDK